VSYDISFREYVKHAIPVSLLAESVYCEAKISNKQLLGEIETPILLQGRMLHEKDAKKALRKFGPTRKAKITALNDAMFLSYANVTVALKKRKVIANSENRKLFISVVPDYGIIGFPDFVDCTNGKQPIIVETKNTSRIPSSPWSDHEIQVAAYSMSLEVLGFTPPHAILRYVTRDMAKSERTFEITINADLKRRTQKISQRVLSIVQGSEPNATTNINKCIPCAYAPQCKWSPLRNQTR
jgi:CRISPR/Cas system-associated exonuclease Cas4 (RecB family)